MACRPRVDGRPLPSGGAPPVLAAACPGSGDRAGVCSRSSAAFPSASTLGPGASADATTAHPAEPDQPLVPRIRSISPDYVPDKGPIVIKGTVTNESDQTWTAINVHGFMGDTPITTAEELSKATDTPTDAYVGDRITVPGTFDSIASLAPGDETSFTVRLPHSALPVTTPGVYWFGVHVLGDDGDGGPRVAVGRDRTFLTYVPDNALGAGAQEDAALVVPIRAGIIRAADGSVLDPDAWRQSLRSGPLHSAVTTGASAQGRPLNWLIDPAVTDVVRRLAHGNPKRTLTAPDSGDEGPSSSPSPSDDSSASGSSASSAADTAPSATAGAARSTGSIAGARSWPPTPASSWVFRTATSRSTPPLGTTRRSCPRRSGAPDTR